MSRFESIEVSLEGIEHVASFIDRRDRNLGVQIRKAGARVPLNLAEGKDRLYSYREAMGSAGDLQVALRTASAWGILDRATFQKALEVLDRLLALLWKLTH